MQTTSQEFPTPPAGPRRRATWRKRSIRVDAKTDVTVFEAGLSEPDAPAILLIHGLGHWTQAAWDFVAAELEATHRVVGFDVPGFGESSKPKVAYDLAYFTHAARAVVAATGLRNFALAGHSLGGLIAANYAATYPGDVRLLVLIDPAGFVRTPKLLLRIVGSRIVTGLMGAVRPSRGFIRHTFNTAVYDPASLDETMHAQMYARAKDPAVVRAFARVYRDALKEFLDLPRLHRTFAQYEGPVLLVWGKQDRYVPIRALEAAKRVYPRAAVTVFERCGHCPSIEYPRELAARLREAGA
jgi:pimeloyl-ACP methyl ester carboxylesterase